MSAELETQIRVGRLLGLAFAFSLVPVGGLGSLAALVLGLRARALIKRSGGRLAGMWLAWWCIIAGAVGAVVLPLMIVPEALRALE